MTDTGTRHRIQADVTDTDTRHRIQADVTDTEYRQTRQTQNTDIPSGRDISDADLSFGEDGGPAVLSDDDIIAA